jgi:hypothetical protein
VLVALALWGGGGQLARAEPAPASKGVRLEVHRGPRAENCPDDAAIRAGVTAQLGYQPFSDPGDRVFVVVIDGADGRYSATVSLQDAAGHPVGLQQLTYRLTSCDELVEAIELAIAVAIDPLAVAPERAVTSQPSAPLKQGTGAASSTPPTTATTTATPNPTATLTSTATVQPRKEPTHRDWRISAGVAAAFSAAPTTVPSLSAGLEVRFPSYSIGLEARGDIASHQPVTGGNLRTSLLFGALVPCYYWRFLGACGLIGAGAEQSAGVGLKPSLTVSTPYFALGARAAADLALTRWLWVRPHVDLWVPIARTTVFAAEEQVWHTPAASPVAGLTLVVALP